MAFRYFLLPNLVAVVVLILVQFRKAQSPKHTWWKVSSLLGVLAGTISVTWFFFAEWSWSLAENWLLVHCSVSSARKSLPAGGVDGSVGHRPLSERSHARSQTQTGPVEPNR